MTLTCTVVRVVASTITLSIIIAAIVIPVHGDENSLAAVVAFATGITVGSLAFELTLWYLTKDTTAELPPIADRMRTVFLRALFTGAITMLILTFSSYRRKVLSDPEYCAVIAAYALGYAIPSVIVEYIAARLGY